VKPQIVRSRLRHYGAGSSERSCRRRDDSSGKGGLTAPEPHATRQRCERRSTNEITIETRLRETERASHSTRLMMAKTGLPTLPKFRRRISLPARMRATRSSAWERSRSVTLGSAAWVRNSQACKNLAPVVSNRTIVSAPHRGRSSRSGPAIATVLAPHFTAVTGFSKLSGSPVCAVRLVLSLSFAGSGREGSGHVVKCWFRNKVERLAVFSTELTFRSS
jgi:hypothetical protein